MKPVSCARIFADDRGGAPLLKEEQEPRRQREVGDDDPAVAQDFGQLELALGPKHVFAAEDKVRDDRKGPRQDVGVDDIAGDVREEEHEGAEVDRRDRQRRQRIAAEHGDDAHRVPQRIEMGAAVLIEVNGGYLDGGDGVAERDRLGEDLGLGLVAPPRHGCQQRFARASARTAESLTACRRT